MADLSLATSVAETIRASKSYGIVTVAYNVTNNDLQVELRDKEMGVRLLLAVPNVHCPQQTPSH